MGRDIHVTSASIGHVRDRVDSELKPALDLVKGLCGKTGVDGVGFGLLGELLIGGSYESMQRWAESQLAGAERACDGWSSALDLARRNWRAAEDASKVRYV
ncbi:MAG: hypothetical protein HOY71_08135 [Nonomuraea sp.]|nr:hypothetical protein [Nonomuraea sp.]